MEPAIVTRRMAREKAMQVLYAYEISQEPIELIVEQVAAPELDKDATIFSFAQNLVYTTLKHRPVLDDMIRAHAKNWALDRFATLDHIIVRMGVAEFLHFPDIPIKVTITEYVTIAIRYSTDQSGRFINGMLDAIAKTAQSEGKITKSGRGLISV